jgi:hypothetical protein
MTTWPSLPSSTSIVCGEFVQPTNPDLGQCSPYRTKKDCEAPALPYVTCADDTYITMYDPDSATHFSVLAKVFDENCEVILDENSLPITAIVQ